MSMSSPIFVYAIYIFFFFSATPQRYVTHVAQLLITQRSLSKIMKWTYVLGPVSWDFHCCSPKILGHYNKDFILAGKIIFKDCLWLPVKLSKIVREMLCTQFTHWKAYVESGNNVCTLACTEMTINNKIRTPQVVLIVGLSWASNDIILGQKKLHLAVRALPWIFLQPMGNQKFQSA